MYTLNPVGVAWYILVAPVVDQRPESPLMLVKYFGVVVKPQEEVSMSVMM